MKRLLPLFFLAATCAAQTPQPPSPPPLPQLLKRVPPAGVAITDADRAELTAGADALGKEITALEKDLASKPELLALLPDVQIFHKAVDWALRYDEIFSPGQVAQAKAQLELGKQRAAELRDGKPSWNSISGADGKPTADGKDKLPALIVRGYKSKIDGSIQPYGVVLPADFKPAETQPRRLDFWCHGRGEKLSELDFLNGRMTQKGDYTPAGAIVIHLYGRYCCANKFAGEIDLFEALADAKKHYPIDGHKLVVRGFSMGGGAAWQFGTHFAGQWAAVQPGAGFGETKEFMKLGTTPDKPLPPEWEQKLWGWYDSADYVSNLANTTTVAYSGEIDGQKQAADIMIRFARQEAGNANPPLAELNKVAPGDGSPSAASAKVEGTGPISFYHVIAPQTPHKVIEAAKPEVEALVGPAVEKGSDPNAKKIHFTTHTLVYPQMKWLTVLGMEKQWDRADVDAEVDADNTTTVKTKNVSALKLAGPANTADAKVNIDGQALTFTAPHTDGLFLYKDGGKWTAASTVRDNGLAKDPTVCGPIDHAFLSSFVFVRPTGKQLNKVVGDWAEAELSHAVVQWRAVFRGNARVIADNAVSDADIANSNLVLWGDPTSNAVLKKIVDKLPLKWDAKQLVFGGKTYDATHIAPVLVFPNPLNPKRYVVINSGFTFREYAALNNANQTPKLPDWAIVDLNSAPDAFYPGRILRAGFFDEKWQAPEK